MKKLLLLSAAVTMLLTSCVSNKKFDALKHKKENLEDEVYRLNAKLDECENQSKTKVASLRDQVATLRNTNAALLNAQGDFALLSKKAAQNLERSLEAIQEKSKQLRSLRDALNRKDSVTLALVTSLKGALGNIHGDDIQIKVDKGVVYVSISDKLLFSSGSYKVTQRAREVLGKVAKVVKAKPEIEIMVEGHTDNVPIHTKCMTDNWDLSVKRATSVVRILQEQYGVQPSRMTAAGRSYYVPIASNETADGRARNRRTRIIVLPKLGKFFEMIEEGMDQAIENSKKVDSTSNKSQQTEGVDNQIKKDSTDTDSFRK